MVGKLLFLSPSYQCRHRLRSSQTGGQLRAFTEHMSKHRTNFPCSPTAAGPWPRGTINTRQVFTALFLWRVSAALQWLSCWFRMSAFSLLESTTCNTHFTWAGIAFFPFSSLCHDSLEVWVCALFTNSAQEKKTADQRLTGLTSVPSVSQAWLKN